MTRTFTTSPPTVGVELEWQLVDARTLDLRDAIMPLLERLGHDPCVKPELHQSAVETIAPPAESTAALRPVLRQVALRLVEAAASAGVAVVGAGTHPFCERLVPITPLPRYAAMEREQGYLARFDVAYALQVHVGMPSGEVAVRVLRDLRSLLPVLLGLSASSPFFRGQDTGFASYRHRLLASARSYGVPPDVEDWAGYHRMVDAAERAGMFGSYRDMRWDARLRPDFGTIEVRVMDAQPTLERSLALTALVHALLVDLASRQGPAGLLPQLPWWIEKENAFRASHRGLDASLVCDAEGHARTLREVAGELFDRVAPTARALGEEGDLARARAFLGDGLCYRDQRDVFRGTGSTREVVRALANQLLDELGLAPLEPRRERVARVSSSRGARRGPRRRAS